MKIGICDDEPHVSKQMQAEVNHYYHSLDILPVTFSHAEQLIEALRKDPDNFLCIFMDIELEGLDGITASRLIQGMNLNIPIILLTSHSEFAPEGYEISAFRFLTKPLDRKKMVEALKAVETMQIRNRKIAICQDGQEIYVSYQDICYIKAKMFTCEYVQPGNPIWYEAHCRNTLSRCLPLFCRVHRSYAVNLSHVQSFDGTDVIMENALLFLVSLYSCGEIPYSFLNAR
ncbi:MAG: LytR/AlgR family response regulator transcription factor [Eisenbergiella sp.]